MKEKLKLIPNEPGSYQMLNNNNQIIYIGKAKNLNKRINSYFKGTVTGKTRLMVNEVTDFKFITTKNEVEAFILELNLIKQYNPKYNILLKDDKSYPYIEYISKPFPKLRVVRYLNVAKIKNKNIFGPYPNAYAANRIVNLINRLYPLKKCKGMPKELCLYYHIGECLGYCVKNIDSGIINSMEDEILSFFKGNDKILTNKINEKIQIHSDNLNYELASELKEELKHIEIILNKQHVELKDYVKRDIISYHIDNNYIGIQFLFIRQGKILGSHFNIINLIGDFKDNISSYLLSFYETHEIPKEILILDDINNKIIEEILNVKINVPKRGEKKHLLNIASNNAKTNLERELVLLQKKEEITTKANADLEKLLNININRIDIFDNSSLFGEYKVSGMVVYKNGLPYKKEYRKYKIKLDHSDDYNMMKEVIYRRYSDALINNKELPDLIILDGGKPQITAAKDILDDLDLNIKIISLVKDEKHKTKAVLNDDYKELNININSNLFKYLTNIQNEVHRFTINFHKQIRKKDLRSSILDDVPGIGDKRKRALLNKYENINNIKNSSIDELSKIIPNNVAQNLKNYLKKIDV